MMSIIASFSYFLLDFQMYNWKAYIQFVSEIFK